MAEQHADHDLSSKSHGVGDALHELALELGLKRPGPRDFQRSDARIREDVCERLAAEPAVDVSEVTVEVNDATVRLEGTVRHRQMKHHIEDISAACLGVKDVENRIRVNRPGPDSGTS
jgi:osmotically-inducible protein OsmY